MTGADLSLLNIDYASVDNTWTYKGLNSLFFRLYYITDGGGSVTHSGRKYILKPGNLYLIPAYTTCDYYCGNSMKLFYIHIMQKASGGLSFFERQKVVFECRALKHTGSIFRRLMELHKGKSLHNVDPDQYSDYEKGLSWVQASTHDKVGIETQGILLQLLSGFIDDEMLSVKGDDPRLVKVLKYVEQHTREKVAVSMLAQIACLHPEYFSKWFCTQTGVCPAGYINRKKIEDAQRQLLFTGDTVELIALRSGFYNHSHFIKTFRKYLGITPAQYRKQNAGGMQGVI